MKKVLLLFAALIAALTGLDAADETAGPGFVFTDASSLAVFGKICQETYEPFSRLPADLETVSRPPVWRLGRCSAGVYVRFRSDAGNFHFRWTSTLKADLDNMAAVGVRGLALYVLDGGRWIYAGSARPDKSSAESRYGVSCSLMEGTMHEYMLYLSLYDGVKTLEIGVPEGRTVEAPEVDSPRTEKAVVIYGTSILQGASASHPGMAGTAQLSRLLDRQVINLGFSGNALLDIEIAELMAAYPSPGAFVLDFTQNGSPELTLEKAEKFYHVLRHAHPDVPVLFVEHPRYPSWRLDGKGRNSIERKNAALKEVFGRLKNSGEKHIFYVKADGMISPDNVGTIEGVHFTDIGFERYARILSRALKKVL